MPSQINSPFAVFTDRDGSPLEAGQVYVGSASQNPQTNPIAVYWDKDLTIPAAQPIMTIAGYPSRSGSPSAIYTAEDDYSITVRDKSGRVVFSSLQVTSLPAFQKKLADSSDPANGADLVGFYDPVAPAYLKTVSDILNMEPVNVLRNIPAVGRSGILAGTSSYDASDKIQELLDAISASGGGQLVLPAGMIRASGIKLKPKVHIVGAGRELSIIKAPDGWSVGNAVETDGFDANYAAANNGTYNIGLKNLSIDGNHENYSGTATSTAGMCLRAYGLRPEIENVRLMAAPGVGFHSALAAATRSDVDWFRKQTKLGFIRGLRVFGCKNDGWYFEGPTDIWIDDVEIGVAGWPDNSALTYLAERPSLMMPSRRVCGAHIKETADIGWLHSFGCAQGFGVILGNGSSLARIKAHSIISESCNGGVDILNNTRYQISTLDAHNCYGWGNDPYLRDASVLEGGISNLEIIGGPNEQLQNKVVMSGSHSHIDYAQINTGSGTSDRGGHGFVIGGTNNKVGVANVRSCKGAAAGGEQSYAFKILSTATQWSVLEGNARDCSGAAVVEVGAGSCNGANFISGFGNTVDFTGFDVLSVEERTNIKLSRLASPRRSTTFRGVSGDISASSTASQTINVPIRTPFAPAPEEIAISWVLVSGTMPTVDEFAIVASGVTNTAVQVRFKFAATTDAVLRIVAKVN